MVLTPSWSYKKIKLKNPTKFLQWESSEASPVSKKNLKKEEKELYLRNLTEPRRNW